MAGVNKLFGTEMRVEILFFQALSSLGDCVHHAAQPAQPVCTKHLFGTRPFAGRRGAKTALALQIWAIGV